MSHEIAREVALRRGRTDWHSIPGAGHGFLAPGESDDLTETTVKWLAR